MRDAIITRKPSLPNGRRTDIALFAICFLFLLFFSAFIVVPPQGRADKQAGEVTANSDKNVNETWTSDDGSPRTVLHAEEAFLVAGRSDAGHKRTFTRR